MLIVDDSPFVRRIVKDWFADEPDFEVVGVASDGVEGVDLAAKCRPELITLDVEMPRLNGLQALEKIMAQSPAAVIMLSSLTKSGASETLRALDLGAIDFVQKPDGPSSIRLVNAKEELLAKARAAVGARRPARRMAAAERAGRPASARPVIRPSLAAGSTTDKVVLIASSTGGPRALTALWSSLPKGFPAPIVVVQHMPPGFTESFAKRLDGMGTVPCKEASVGDRLIPGLALMAPGGRHLHLRKDGSIVFSDDATLHGVRPAADYMFQSGAAAFGSRCVAAVLTGMGKDGAAGALQVRQAGGTVLGESEASCVIYGMPKAAKEIGAVHEEFSIEEMASALLGCLARRSGRAA